MIADGTITNETVQEFRRLSKEADFVPRRILLNSDGGSLEGAIALGLEWRKKDTVVVISTVVDNPDMPGEGWKVEEYNGARCLSACVYALLGARERIVPTEAKIGIHSFQLGGYVYANELTFSSADITDAQKLTGNLLAYVQEMGADPILVKWASEVPEEEGDGFRYLSHEELNAVRINWQPLLANPFRLEPNDGGLMLITETADNSATAFFVCKSKELYLIFSTEGGEYRNGDAGENDITINLSLLDKNFMFLRNDGLDFIQNHGFYTSGSKAFRTILITPTILNGFKKAPFFSIAFGATRGEILKAQGIFPLSNIGVYARLLGRNCL